MAANVSCFPGEVDIRSLQESDMVRLEVTHCFVYSRCSRPRSVSDPVHVGGLLQVLLNLVEIVNRAVDPVLRTIIALNTHAVYHKFHAGNCCAMLNLGLASRGMVFALCNGPHDHMVCWIQGEANGVAHMHSLAFIFGSCQPFSPFKHFVAWCRAPNLEAKRNAEEMRRDEIVHISELFVEGNLQLPLGGKLFGREILGPPLSVYQLRQELRSNVGGPLVSFGPSSLALPILHHSPPALGCNGWDGLVQDEF